MERKVVGIYKEVFFKVVLIRYVFMISRDENTGTLE